MKKCCTVREPVSERRAANQRALLRKLPFMARAAAAPPYKTRRRAAQPLLRPSAARTGHSTSPLVRLRRPTPPPGKPAGWPGARSAPALTARPFHRPALPPPGPRAPAPRSGPVASARARGVDSSPGASGPGCAQGASQALPTVHGAWAWSLGPSGRLAARDGTGRDGRTEGGRAGAAGPPRPGGDWALGTGCACSCVRARAPPRAGRRGPGEAERPPEGVGLPRAQAPAHTGRGAGPAGVVSARPAGRRGLNAAGRGRGPGFLPRRGPPLSSVCLLW